MHYALLVNGAFGRLCPFVQLIHHPASQSPGGVFFFNLLLATFQYSTLDRLPIEKVLVSDRDWSRHNLCLHQLPKGVIVQAISL